MVSDLESQVCVPKVYRINDNISSIDFDNFKSTLSPNLIFDRIEIQLNDLVKLENPEIKHSSGFIESAIREKLNGRNINCYGVWVFYPWSGRLVHCLDELEFVKVRTIRNRYKIQQIEQDKLNKKIIGVVGLSVGQSAAMTLAMERVCGEIRIADYDTLELSNLNRIRTSVTNIGLPKTTVVAREIAEIDPFLKVTVFHEGITVDNVNRFFDEGGSIDLLIEECDSVEYKVLLRSEAKRRRIPVVMDTSDRGMLDVERYDQNPNYPLFHGKIDSNIDFNYLSSLKSSEDKLPYIVPILDIQTVSNEFKASGLEVGKSITTWPQLASDVVLGGALCCNVSRRILLGDDISSDRYFVDLNELIAGKRSTVNTEILLDEGFLNRVNVKEYVLSLNLSGGDEVSEQVIQDMLSDAIKASSPGNSQKWLWAQHGSIIHLFVDKSQNIGFADNFNFGSLIGLGCAVENLRLSAAMKGYQILIHWQEELNELNHALSITFKKDNQNLEYIDLYSVLSNRHCNRNHCEYQPLTEQEVQKLTLPTSPLIRFQLLTDRDFVNKIGELVCKGDRIRLTNIYGHQDFFKNEIRWSRDESITKGDGLDVTLFNLTELDKLGLELSKDIEVIRKINEFGGGKGFERISEKAFIGASAIGVIWVNDYSLRSLIEAGIYTERIWLQATKLGLGFQPYTVLQMLFTRLHRDDLKYLTENQKEEVTKLKEVFDEILISPKGFESVFLFRLNKAETPIGMSCRKPLSEKLVIV